MKDPEIYVDLDGQEIYLGHLDVEERQLLVRIKRKAKTLSDWDAFDNWWTVAVTGFYAARGMDKKAVPRTIPWRIAQDYSSRLAVSEGQARLGDYRDDLERLVRERFPSRRAFCEATGLSETMLSHVLAGRKDLSLTSLTRALDVIGFRLVLRPGLQKSRTARPGKQANENGRSRTSQTKTHL
jgi:hypothetical protein